MRRGSQSFFTAGIRFACQGTGTCCQARGSYGYVFLSLADRQQLAAHLGLSTATFTRRYCSKTDEAFHLKHPERDCCFLVDKRCHVYEARPLQCRTWPFWRENMNPRVWKREVASTCPGVGRGRLYSCEEIQRILDLNPD